MPRLECPHSFDAAEPRNARPRRPRPGTLARGAALGLLVAFAVTGARAGDGVCGMNVGGATNPADLAHGDSDLSLAHMAEQPAGILVCSAGYMAEKCGDHVTALKIFDKCIAKGYAGAMIWKGQMYESGVGLPRDDARAAALYRQAAESGEGHYGALGKLHYASALHEGKGVPRDEAAARTWFQRAANEGSEDAAEFLRTGHHTGSRDLRGQGVGVPTDAVQGQSLVRQSKALPSPAPWRERVAAVLALLALLGLGAARHIWRGSDGARPTSTLRAARPAPT